MNIEEVTAENVGNISTTELKSLRHRAVQLHDRTEMGKAAIRKRTVGVTQPIPEDRFIDAYGIIVSEVVKRGGYIDRTDIDAVLCKKAVRGVDVSLLPTIVLREGAVCLTGKLVEDPKHAGTVGVWLDDDGYPEELSKRMVEAILDQTGKAVAIVDDLAVCTIPAYDLTLTPRHETRDLSIDVVERLSKRREDREEDNILDISESFDISKPYPSEHAARQLDPNQFGEMRRENNKFGTGIHAIWGILPSGKVKLQSIRFDRKKFTPAQAKAWLKEHKHKTTIEAAAGVKKGIFVKSDEERIVAGVVYAPDEVDSQGDYTDADEIWKGMKSHMIQSNGKICLMHDGVRKNVAIVECFQADEDTVKGGDVIPAGAWYLSVYVPPEMEEVWKAVKRGDITGFSMGGQATTDD